MNLSSARRSLGYSVMHHIAPSRTHAPTTENAMHTHRLRVDPPDHRQRHSTTIVCQSAVTTRDSLENHPSIFLRQLLALSAIVTFTASCGDRGPRQPDLPRQPDRWVTSVVLDTSSRVRYIGKTKDYFVTSVTTAKDLAAPRAISIGDEIEGLHVGAIKCSFHWRDAYYGKEQYMWRGRWACQAGRSRQEIESAVAENGDKRFDYIHLSPVRLDSN